MLNSVSSGEMRQLTRGSSATPPEGLVGLRTRAGPRGVMRFAGGGHQVHLLAGKGYNSPGAETRACGLERACPGGGGIREAPAPVTFGPRIQCGKEPALGLGRRGAGAHAGGQGLHEALGSEGSGAVNGGRGHGGWEQGPDRECRMGAHSHDQGAGGRGLGGLGLWISLDTRFWGCAGHPFQDYVAAEWCPLLGCLSITPMVSGWTNPRTSLRTSWEHPWDPWSSGMQGAPEAFFCP